MMKKLIYQTALIAYVNAICFSPAATGLDQRVLRFLNNITGTSSMIPRIIHMSHTTDFKDYFTLKVNGTSICKIIMDVW